MIPGSTMGQSSTIGWGSTTKHWGPPTQGSSQSSGWCTHKKACAGEEDTLSTRLCTMHCYSMSTAQPPASRNSNSHSFPTHTAAHLLFPLSPRRAQQRRQQLRERLRLAEWLRQGRTRCP